MEAGQEQVRNIEAMFLGPDSWNDRGDERTLAGEMTGQPFNLPDKRDHFGNRSSSLTTLSSSSTLSSSCQKAAQNSFMESRPMGPSHEKWIPTLFRRSKRFHPMVNGG